MTAVSECDSTVPANARRIDAAIPAVSSTPAVLIVDDDRWVTKALERLFRSSGHPILTANSGAEALEILSREKDVGVVVSDQNMPAMTGTELFAEIRRRHPDAMRILLTGRADLDAMVEAINKGKIYKFLIKPWDNGDLVEAVEEALRHHQLELDNRRLLHQLESTNTQLKEINATLEERVQQKAEALLRVTSFDSVTGLPNRSLLTERLQQALNAWRSSDRTGSVLVFDLNRFKLVNESLGMVAGDELLRQVAERLGTCIRATDTAARLASDEFCILLADSNSRGESTQVATRILDAMNKPFALGTREVFLSGSIGISSYPGDGEDGETLLQNAEATLHHMKEHGQEGYAYYSRHINRHSNDRLELEADLRRALEQGDFRLHYQPRIEIATGRICAAEALLRWQHPERGLVAPGQFIPVLESTGLIEPVGEWVLNEACNAVTRWRDDGHNVLIAVNLSPRQLQQGRIIEKIRRLLSRLGPRVLASLELEITESLLMEDASLAQRTLRAINALGIKIAIDDFGTGYSSLSYLTRFPIDYIKIDRSFVSELATNPEAGAIVQAITAMAHSLGHRLIAEGVETDAQLDVIAGLGCEEFQGYLVSAPVNEDRFRELLAAGSYRSSSTQSESPKAAFAG